MRTTKSTTRGLPALFLLTVPSCLSADLITFTFTGNSGSGTVGSVPFSNAPFVIRAIGNTDNRVPIDGGAGISLDHDWASITIDGLGTFTLLSPTRTFYNFPGFIGLSRGGPGGLDLYEGPFDSVAFAGYDLASSVGPVTGQTQIVQWDVEPQIDSTGGIIEFDHWITDGTFSAVLPTPSGAATFGLVAAAALSRRRR